MFEARNPTIAQVHTSPNLEHGNLLLPKSGLVLFPILDEEVGVDSIRNCISTAARRNSEMFDGMTYTEYGRNLINDH